MNLPLLAIAIVGMVISVDGLCRPKTKAYNKFVDKHYLKSSTTTSSEDLAKQKSCDRNANGGKPKYLGYSEQNSILFDEDEPMGNDGVDKDLITSQGLGSNRCGLYFDDVYQCTNVPKWDWKGCFSKAYCRSCKNTYAAATKFYLEVNKDNGHLFYDHLWWYDGSKATWNKLPHTGGKVGTQLCV